MKLVKLHYHDFTIDEFLKSVSQIKNVIKKVEFDKTFWSAVDYVLDEEHAYACDYLECKIRNILPNSSVSDYDFYGFILDEKIKDSHQVIVLYEEKYKPNYDIKGKSTKYAISVTVKLV